LKGGEFGEARALQRSIFDVDLGASVAPLFSRGIYLACQLLLGGSAAVAQVSLTR
jgi:hypothetical protein